MTGICLHIFKSPSFRFRAERSSGMYGALFIARSILAGPLDMTSVEFRRHPSVDLTPLTLHISSALDCSVYRPFQFSVGVCAFITAIQTTVLTLSLIIFDLYFYLKFLPILPEFFCCGRGWRMFGTAIKSPLKMNPEEEGSKKNSISDTTITRRG